MQIPKVGKRLKQCAGALGFSGILTSPLMLWCGSVLELIPVKYVPNETTDLLGELHQFSSLLLQLLFKLKVKAVTQRGAA